MSFKFLHRALLALALVCIIASYILFIDPGKGYFNITFKYSSPLYHTSYSKPKDRLYSSSPYLPPRLLLTSKERVSNLKRHCSIHGRRSWSSLSLDEKRVTSRMIIVDDQYRILYCYFPKVACSNWKRVFAVLDGQAMSPEAIRKVDHSKFKLLSDYPPLGVEWRLKNYYKFLFVREPLERLVSTYKDKFLVYREYFNKRWGSKIVKRFRKKPKNQDEDNMPENNVPTLSEFFKYLVKAKPLKMDIHWMPYKELSRPCVISYDFIGSFDRLEHDAARVLRELNIQDKVHFPKKQKYYNTAYSNFSFDHFVGQVPGSLLNQVVKKYIKDYELFSYPVPKFEN